MTQNLNIPSSTPSETSTLLVSRLRTTLDTQWKKFEDSLPVYKGASSKYQAMKAGYDGLKSDLAKIADDEVLKKDTSIQSKLDEFLIKIATHLTDATRDRQYDGILTETQSKVGDLRSEIYGKVPDAKVIVPAVVAGGITVAASNAPTPTIEQVAASAQSQIQESTKGFRGWVAEKVKAPGMMGDIFRDLEKKATSWVKDLTTPPTGSWIDSPWEHMKFQLKKWFAPLLAGWFGINLDGTKPGGITPEQKPEVKPMVTPETIVDDVAFKVGYKGFVRMYYSSVEGISPDISPIDIDSAFQYTPFLSMKYSDAEGLYRKHKSNHKGLLSEPQFSGITNAEGAFAALSLIVSGRSGEFLKKRYLNVIKDMTIKDLISGIKDSFDIAEGIEGIVIGGMEDITGFMGKLGEKMDVSFDNGRISQDGIKVKADKIGLTNTKLLAFTLFDGRARPISDFSNDASIDGLSDINPEGKKKLREIMAFGKAIISTLTKNCSLGEEAKYVEKFKTVNPTLGDITKMYIMLSGKTDFSTMSQAEHMYCYQKTWNFLGADQDFRGKYFDKPMYMAIADKTSTVITPEMRETMQRIMYKSVETMMKKMRGIAGEIYNAMEWYHVAAVGAALGVYLMYGKKLAWIGTGIALAAIANILADVLSRFPKGSDGKYTLPSGTKITPQEGAEALTKEAERIGK